MNKNNLFVGNENLSISPKAQQSNIETRMPIADLERNLHFEESEQVYINNYFSDNDDEETLERMDTAAEEGIESETPEYNKTDRSYSLEDGDRVMFEKSKTTVNDVVEMVVAYCLRYGISHEGRTMLLEMLKICAGQDFQNLRVHSGL